MAEPYVNDIERYICDEIAAAEDELICLASDLISFDTTARNGSDPPREEQQLQEYVASRLRKAGAAVEMWEPNLASTSGAQRIPADIEFSGRPQFLATFPGSGNGRSLLLNGHIDVVTPEPADHWTSDPWRATVRNGMLYGRGACDMKGGIASLMLAAETLARKRVALAGNLLIALNTDEESSGAGSVACVEHGIRADAGICAEPTGGEIWIASRGSQSVTVTVDGRAGHAELPQPPFQQGGAVNAIDKAAIIVRAIHDLNDHWSRRPDQRHAYLSPGTILTTQIRGGEWYVTYPAACQLTANLMYLPSKADPDGFGSGVRREVEEWVLRACAGDPWLRSTPPRLEWGPDLPPFEVPDSHPFVSVLNNAARASAMGATIGGLDSWFDAANFTRSGAAVMMGYGPGETNIAHTIDEYVPTADLVSCAQVFAITAMRWCDAPQRNERGSRAASLRVVLDKIGNLVGAKNGVTLRDLRIFMDQATEPVPAQNPDVGA